MVSLGQVFDANTVAPAAPIEVLPPGDYTVQIVRSEMKLTADKMGKFLELEMDVIDGSFVGRKMWDRLNLVNANAQAAEIAARTLSAICHATGQMAVSDSEQLHFKPLIATVKVRPAGPDKTGVHREAQNNVAGYKAAGSAPARTHTTAPAAVKPAAAAGAVPPWRKAATAA